MAVLMRVLEDNVAQEEILCPCPRRGGQITQQLIEGALADRALWRLVGRASFDHPPFRLTAQDAAWRSRQ